MSTTELSRQMTETEASLILIIQALERIAQSLENLVELAK